jgi:predicted HTH domain antitoxin
MAVLHINLPDELLTLSDQTEETLQDLAREALLVRLYDQSKITSSWAAQTLGISRREFLDLLGQYEIPEFDEDMDVASEAKHD